VAVDVGEKLLGEVCLQQIDQLNGVISTETPGG
jgi:hypothetical protein